MYGRIPEWPKGTDCKSAANCFDGSNPSPSICRSGGTGRRPGLKIPWVVIPVPVRFRSAAWLWDARNVDFSMFLAFFVIKYFDYTFISPAEIVKNNEQGIFCYWLVGLLMRTKCICCDLRNWKASSIFALLTNLSSIVFDGTSSIIIMIMSA